MSIMKVSALAAVFIGLAAGSARAEETILMKVKVPFQFVVHGEVLPAGTYDVWSGDDGMTGVWLKGEKKNTAATVTFTAPDRTEMADPSAEKPALVFTQFENQYRLSQIREGGTDYVVVNKS